MLILFINYVMMGAPVFYAAFETNAVEPPLILMGVRKTETRGITWI